jgi:lysophospholipase L1-like esterase
MKYGLPKIAKTNEPVGFKTVANAVYTTDGSTVQDHLNKLNNKVTDTPLSNLKLGIIGDGILAGYGLDDPNTTTFAALLQNHFASCLSYSASGRMLAYMEDDLGHPTPIVTDYATMDNNLDVILVHASTNDWYYSTPMGTKSDTDITTYYGALNTLINGLQTKYFDKDIFFITPLSRTDDHIVDGETITQTSDENNVIGFNLQNYIDVLKEVCGKHSMPVIDLNANSGINIAHNPKHKEYYTFNGVHLTVAGHHKEYKYLFNELSNRL